MKTYIKFLIKNFYKSLLSVFTVMVSLIFLINLLSEIEFFNKIIVNSYLPLYLALINTPSIIFEMFPFIFLLTAQFFFIKLFNNNELQIFKYSGLKNSKILNLLALLSFATGTIIITLFYNFSSSLKNFYFEVKNQYSEDNTYLAVITKNGLWIKDVVGDNISIIHASKIDKNFLNNTFISKFNNDFNIIENIKSDKIDIKDKTWKIENAKIFKDKETFHENIFLFKSNFNLQIIQGLFSNLSSLGLIKLINLRDNYKNLNYSTTEVDIQIYKIFTYPFYLTIMTILSSLIMFNSKKFKSSIFKISFGLFLSVIIYYFNNFFYILGATEKIPALISILSPLIIMSVLIFIMSIKINEK
jgi:lipopolysaccharide export system permease protein